VSTKARYSERLDAAVALAARDFRTVVRKGTTIPYLTHLFAVMSLVGENGGDEDQLIAAVLHDWLEDVPGARVETLEAQFGPRVAGLVAGLSDSVGHPKPPWRERKERYLAHLRDALPDLKLISAADKVHNCASIRRDLAEVGPAVFARFTGGREGTLWYYEALGGALATGWQHPLARRVAEEAALLRREAGAAG
jgi:(p)ppGpp synthase/HD superfamily hydrolase